MKYTCSMQNWSWSVFYTLQKLNFRPICIYQNLTPWFCCAERGTVFVSFLSTDLSLLKLLSQPSKSYDFFKKVRIRPPDKKKKIKSKPLLHEIIVNDNLSKEVHWRRFFSKIKHSKLFQWKTARSREAICHMQVHCDIRHVRLSFASDEGFFTRNVSVKNDP